MEELRSIDLRVTERLKSDRAYRREWFRAELETGVPETFRTMRERREMTQTQLADDADMKQSAVSRFEKSSEATWKMDTLLRYAEAVDAQLIITLKPAEEAIAEMEREDRANEVSGSVSSVLTTTQRAPEDDDFNQPVAHSAAAKLSNFGDKRGVDQHRGRDLNAAISSEPAQRRRLSRGDAEKDHGAL